MGNGNETVQKESKHEERESGREAREVGAREREIITQKILAKAEFDERGASER